MEEPLKTGKPSAAPSPAFSENLSPWQPPGCKADSPSVCSLQIAGAIQFRGDDLSKMREQWRIELTSD
jgi:hypothetical protein